MTTKIWLAGKRQQWRDSPDAWARFKTRAPPCAKGWLPAHPLPSRLPFSSLQLGSFFPQLWHALFCRRKDRNKSQWLCFHLVAAPSQFPPLLAPTSPSLGCSPGPGREVMQTVLGGLLPATIFLVSFIYFFSSLSSLCGLVTALVFPGVLAEIHVFYQLSWFSSR